MSSFLFPYTLPGIQFGYKRAYDWDTLIQISASGKVSSAANRQYPLVKYEYSFEFLRDAQSSFLGVSAPDITALVGLHNAVRGRLDTFLHTDPDFNSVTAQQFGTGDGTTAAFQLVAQYGNTGGPSVAELIQNLNGTPTLYDNGTPIAGANYTIGATGIVTFGSGHIPANTHVLTWTGSWYYRCRFDEDSIDWEKFMYGLWRGSKIAFTSVKL